MAKAWPVGREGLVGISLFLGNPKRDNRADVQIAGLAFRLPAAALLTEFKRAGTFQQLVAALRICVGDAGVATGRVQSLLTPSSSDCAGFYRAFSIEYPSMRSLSRTSESQCCSAFAANRSRKSRYTLQSAGIIEYQRGHIKLISRKKLEERSCVCGAIIRRAFQSVFEQGSAELQPR